MVKQTFTRLARWMLLALLLTGLSLAAPPAQAHRPVAPPQKPLYGANDIPDGLTAADWNQIQALMTPVQQAYLKASNTEANDYFGYSVAVSGDTVVVGAYHEDSNATGVNAPGGQADNSAFNAGAAYVFTRSGASWSQQAYLKASNTEAYDEFGYSVAVSGDTAVVGARYEDSNATGVNGPGGQANNSASSAGAAYVFTRSGTTWSQQAYLKASNTGAYDEFGYSVAVSGDTVVVGASREASNATGVNGNQADNSAVVAGAAYVFVRSGTTWSQQAYLKASNTEASDQFGWSVAVSGDTAVVGACGEDSNATGVNAPDGQADNSAVVAGAAYVFVRSGTTWSQQAYLKASNTEAYDSFGYSVAMSGDTIVVGAWYESSNATGINGDGSNNSANSAGAAYVFVRNGTAWSQQVYLKASNTGAADDFGWSVAVSGDTVVVGACREDSNATGINGNQADNSVPQAGAAYIFVRSGTTWSQQAYLKASNTGGNDYFGYSVAVSDNTIVVGAYQEDSNATGVNNPGGQADNSAGDAGAVYVLGNVAPIANAGLDQAKSANQTVTLDGSQSSDDNGDTLTYGWTQAGGPAVPFTPNVSVTTFIAPNAAAAFTFTLTVTDTGSLTGTDEIVVMVSVAENNYLPIILKNIAP